MTRVSVVIVTYNGIGLLDACLGPVLDQARASAAEVVVVDNGSIDGSADFVARTYPEVVLVRNLRNEGFAGGCNSGVRAAMGEIIVLLNNDAVPRPGWLANLVAPLLLTSEEPAATGHDGAGPEVAITCSVVHEERFDDAYALGTGSLSVIGHPIPNVASDQTRPFYATGCSLAFKRRIFGEPFDPLFFAYYEDALLSWRARLQKYEVVRVLASEVDHLGSVTARRQPRRMRYYWERNKLLTLLLCYESATLWRLLPLYLFDSLARLVEDAWHLLAGPTRKAPLDVAGGYVATARAVLWVSMHLVGVDRRRRLIQRDRQVPDRGITVRLSGKIFDDLVSTRAHTIANCVAQRYCRLMHIATAETAPPRRPLGQPLAPLLPQRGRQG